MVALKLAEVSRKDKNFEEERKELEQKKSVLYKKKDELERTHKKQVEQLEKMSNLYIWIYIW